MTQAALTQSGFFEPRHISPTGITVVIALHAAMIAAVVAWKVDVVRLVDPDIKVWNVPRPDDPPPTPPEPQPQADSSARPQESRAVAQQDTIVRIPDMDSVVEPIPPVRSDEMAARPVAEPPRLFEAARAKGDVRTLISEDDYPEAALRNEESGSVQLKLAIGPDGNVTDCTVLRTSGSRALDTTTCRLLKKRARFVPAKDMNGQPVSDTYVTPRITWKLVDTA